MLEDPLSMYFVVFHKRKRVKEAENMKVSWRYFGNPAQLNDQLANLIDLSKMGTGYNSPQE
jgi:hypothetical protein